MDLPRRLFWDVNYDNIDWDVKYKWVIVRVFERGDVDDIRQVRRYYGDGKVREALTSVKWLPLQTIYLACAVLDNDLTDYRCYTSAQSNRKHWTY